MSLDDISHSQFRRNVLSITEFEILLESGSSSSSDEIRSRMFVDTVDDRLPQDLDVVRRDSVGESKNSGDVFRNGDLRVELSVADRYREWGDVPDRC